MLGIEFMTMSLILGILTIISWIGFLVIVGWAITPIITGTAKPKERIGALLVAFCAMCIAVIMGYGASQPKLVIQTPKNSALYEYQNNTNDIVITTPPPRTETLDGFKSLGSD